MDRSLLSRSSGFLAGIPDRGFDALADLSRRVDFAPGSAVFLEGSAHPDFHILLSGHVRLDMSVAARGRVPLLTVGPGDILAWSALLNHGPMTTSAVALDAVTSAAIDGDELEQFCQAHPATGYILMKHLSGALARRLVATRLQLLDLFAQQDSWNSGASAHSGYNSGTRG